MHKCNLYFTDNNEALTEKSIMLYQQFWDNGIITNINIFSTIVKKIYI